MNGFISIDYSILEWEWYKDANTMRLFLHCLLKANWKDGRFEGHEVPRGSFITSIGHMAKELNISTQNVRTALGHLEKTGEINKQITNRFTLITVNNYCKYQEPNRQLTSNQQTTNNQLTNNQQTTNNQLTTIEQSNKENKVTKQQGNNSNKGTFKPPTLTEVQEYIFQNNFNIKADRFIDYYQSNGWKVGRNPMKDWKAAVRQWATREKQYTKPDITDRTGAVDTWVERYGQRETNSPFS